MLAGASDPVDADSIGHAHVSQVLPLLAQNFDYVVVDTPAGLDERTLAALECATDLLLVSSLDVTSIRSLRKALDALDHIGVTAERRLRPQPGRRQGRARPVRRRGRDGHEDRLLDPVEPGDPAVAEPGHARS